MINHARTLLHNSKQLMVTGEEYVPPEFNPLVIPEPFNVLWQQLYGSFPSPLARCYRTRELMTLLHGSDLAKHLSEFDPRVTYWPSDDTELWGPTPKDLVPLNMIYVPLNMNAAKYQSELFMKNVKTMELHGEWVNAISTPTQIAAVVLALIHKLKELH